MLPINPSGLTPRHHECSPITPSLGAEVSDVDLQTPISTSTASQLRQALNKHHVLVFRSQHLDREAHKAVARCLVSCTFIPLGVILRKIRIRVLFDRYQTRRTTKQW